jgi:Flp pilus assembly protein TadB
MAENNKTSGGIGFCGLLAIVFITLKLTRVIDWLWVWVLAPIWIPAALILAICAIVLIVQAKRIKRRTEE